MGAADAQLRAIQQPRGFAPTALMLAVSARLKFL